MADLVGMSLTFPGMMTKKYFSSKSGKSYLSFAAFLSNGEVCNFDAFIEGEVKNAPMLDKRDWVLSVNIRSFGKSAAVEIIELSVLPKA